jgi:hypothetical protein
MARKKKQLIAYTQEGSTEGTNRNTLKALYQGYRDTQLDRIRRGNRLVANFYNRLGVAPGTKLEQLDKNQLKIIDKLKADHKMITEGITSETGQQIKSAIKRVNPDLIHDFTDWALTKTWISAVEDEDLLLSAMKDEMKSFDIWRFYLENVNGVGPSIGSTIIALFDIREADYVSSFWKYAGLDTVNNVTEDESENEPVYRLLLEDPWGVKGGHKGAYIFPEGDANKKQVYEEKSFKFKKGSSEVIISNPNLYNVINPGDHIAIFPGGANIAVIEDKDDSPLFSGVYGEGRSRKESHQEMREYTNKDGVIDIKKGLTYNPKIKTVLLGVLSDTLIKSNPHYRKIYWDYKNRIINDPRRKDRDGKHLLPDGRITKMATRYMIKMFVLNLWVAWKYIENLPILRAPYHMEKLGLGFHPDPAFDPKKWVEEFGRTADTAPLLEQAIRRTA